MTYTCGGPTKPYYLVQDRYSHPKPHDLGDEVVFTRSPIYKEARTMPSAFAPCQYDKQTTDPNCATDCRRKR